jgi:hypothetical protein
VIHHFAIGIERAILAWWIGESVGQVGQASQRQDMDLASADHGR